MPRSLYPRERSGTHGIGGWVDPRAGLDWCWETRPQRDSIPLPSSPSRVAIPTELPRPRHEILQAHGWPFCNDLDLNFKFPTDGRRRASNFVLEWYSPEGSSNLQRVAVPNAASRPSNTWSNVTATRLLLTLGLRIHAVSKGISTYFLRQRSCKCFGLPTAWSEGHTSRTTWSAK
jgi:hypothetical protein